MYCGATSNLWSTAASWMTCRGPSFLATVSSSDEACGCLFSTSTWAELYLLLVCVRSWGPVRLGWNWRGAGAAVRESVRGKMLAPSWPLCSRKCEGMCEGCWAQHPWQSRRWKCCSPCETLVLFGVKSEKDAAIRVWTQHKVQMCCLVSCCWISKVMWLVRDWWLGRNSTWTFGVFSSLQLDNKSPVLFLKEAWPHSTTSAGRQWRAQPRGHCKLTLKYYTMTI